MAGREVVTELVADTMTVANIRKELARIVAGGPGREQMLAGYDCMIGILGAPGASARAARLMVELLRKKR